MESMEDEFKMRLLALSYEATRLVADLESLGEDLLYKRLWKIGELANGLTHPGLECVKARRPHRESA
ncbi:hypothetical protein [Sphingorhabdus sp.]|uniref:hypothetical protein n=1 Tax=Sphingorhabdus sp. TaxID=1902408 RepID=UPI002FDAACCC